MGKMKNALVKLAKKITGKEIETNSMSEVLEEIAEGYNDKEGSHVEANVELEGTESDLTSLEVDGVKFKVPEGAEPYVLPIASANTLGGVKVGSGAGLSISSNGVLSLAYGLVYRHFIKLKVADYVVRFTLYTSSSAQFTGQTLYDFIVQNYPSTTNEGRFFYSYCYDTSGSVIQFYVLEARRGGFTNYGYNTVITQGTYNTIADSVASATSVNTLVDTVTQVV